MSKTVKFYFTDSSVIELKYETEEEEFSTTIIRKPRVFLHIFKAYLTFPKTMILKNFYTENLVGKNIDRVELYLDDFLVDSLSRGTDHIVSATWETGQLQKTDEPLQERIVITELYINN